MNSYIYALYLLMLFWLLTVGIGFLLKKRVKSLEVSVFSIMYRKKASFKFLSRLENKKWFNAYLVLSIIATLFSMLLFYILVGTISLHRVSGGGGGGGLVPLIPGVTLRGTTLIYVLIVIGYSATLHELAHAAAAIHSKVPVKSTGLILFFFIPAAFVEPDEEVFKKARLFDKAKVLSAGPAVNLYVGLAFFLALLLLAHGIIGAQIVSVEPSSPAEKYGLKPGMIITEINGTLIKNINDVGKVIQPYKHINASFNFTVKLLNGTARSIIVFKSSNHSLVGITVTAPKAITGLPNSVYYPLIQFIFYSYIINISLAIINAAPLFISDGGRLVSEFLKEKVGGNRGKILNFFIQITTLLIVLFSISLIPL